MTTTAIPPQSLKRLTPTEVERYRTEGYIMGFRIFDAAGVQRNLHEFDRLVAMLKPGQTTTDINNWERTDPFLFSLASNPMVLDYVEDIIGPNIMLWSTHAFCKYPGDGKDVAWHQDAYYWPLRPHKNVTVWLAFDDSDEENGGMNIIPGTHRIGSIDHEEDKRPGRILHLKIKQGLIDESKAICVRLKAGEISLHDDNVVHGSKANRSTRRRCGLTMRYVTPDVKCDLKVWPGFKTCLMRSINACISIPTLLRRPARNHLGNFRRGLASNIRAEKAMAKRTMNKAFTRWLAAAMVAACSIGMPGALAEEKSQPASTGAEILLPTRQALAWEKLSEAAAPSGSPVAGYGAAVQPPAAAAAGGVNLFALDLYGRLRDQDRGKGGEGNLFFSPYSISSAMAMVYAGARGNTAAEIVSAMPFSCRSMAQLRSDESDREAIVSSYRELTHRLRGDMKQSGFQLVFANSLWGQIGHPILPEYLDVVKEDFGGDATAVDFAGHAEQARQQINKWVSDATHAKIPALLAPDAISPDDRIVLANAIYFKAAWMDQFDAKSTAKADFHAGNGKTVQADMMHAGLRLLYAEDDQCQMLELPYSGGELAMIILLPKANAIAKPDYGRSDQARASMDQLESMLSTSYIAKLTFSASDHQVNLALPRWEAAQTILLGRILQDMGIKRAFTNVADFTGIDGQADLFLSDVTHKACIHVDEEGTEVAAATAAILEHGMAPPAPPVDFTANHPFAYFIVHKPTNTILFAGRLCDPTASR